MLIQVDDEQQNEEVQQQKQREGASAEEVRGEQHRHLSKDKSPELKDELIARCESARDSYAPQVANQSALTGAQCYAVVKCISGC